MSCDKLSILLSNQLHRYHCSYRTRTYLAREHDGDERYYSRQTNNMPELLVCFYYAVTGFLNSLVFMLQQRNQRCRHEKDDAPEKQET